MFACLLSTGPARRSGLLCLALTFLLVGGCASGGGAPSGPAPQSDGTPSAENGDGDATSGRVSVSAAVSRLEMGDEIRLVLDGERVTGPLLYQNDRIVEVRDGMRQRQILMGAIQEVQVRRDGRSWGLPMAIAGAGGGALAFKYGGLGIEGDKEKQGDALNPFLGAVAGSLVGAAIGSLIGGDYWQTVGAAGR